MLPNYLISNHGEVKHAKTGRIRKGQSDRGYIRGNFATKKGEQKAYKFHRLVALAFVENPRGVEVVNHLDGDKLNNRADNLEWCTPGENQEHAYELGLKKPYWGKETRHKSVLNLPVTVTLLDGHQIKFSSAKDASRNMGISSSNVSNRLKDGEKCHKGFVYSVTDA